MNNNDNTKNVNCFSFYETNLKKSAVNSELLSKVQKQNGGMKGIIYAATVAGIAVITMLSESSQVESNTFNKNKFVNNEKALNENPSYELNFFRNNQIWGICAQNAYIVENSMGGICTDAEWKAADPNGISWITENYKWSQDPDLMNGNTQNLTFGVSIHNSYMANFLLVFHRITVTTLSGLEVIFNKVRKLKKQLLVKQPVQM